jgi:cytochrome c5
MHCTYRKTALWICITISSALVAFGAAQNAPKSEKGEQILNQACMSCHDFRPIDTQALDQEGWTKMVKAMVEKGASVSTEDIPVLVDYLVRKHGPLPNGAGKKILLETCTLCHDLQRVREHSGTREEWEGLLVHMMGEGAPLADEDFDVLLNYLSRNFR